MVAAVVAAVQADPRIVGLTVGGSASEGTMDEFSDLDFVVICRDEHQPELLREAPAFAARLGPLLAWFTGEHVGEPRLRGMVFGPLTAQARGRRAAGVRRIEQMAPDLVPALAGTVGDHTPHGCAAALRASVGLYRQLRGDAPGLVRHTRAEAASLDYLAQIEARLPSTSR
jgi:hypothetical protein